MGKVEQTFGTVIKTKDGIEFTVTTNDVITLTSDQFNELAATVIRRKASYIVKDGVDIVSLNEDQIAAVLAEIKDRTSNSEDPLKDDLIRISGHIIKDHSTNPKELERRGWYRDTVDEIFADIVSVIRAARDVQKAKVGFDASTQSTIDTFTFTVLGVKINGEEGRVSIAFVEDGHDLVLAVTIV